MDNMVAQEMDQLTDEVRAQMVGCPPTLLPPVVEAVVAALRKSRPELGDAVVGEVLMTAAMAAARANVEAGEFLTAKSMALALAAAGLQFYGETSAGTSQG
ncbi:hypothetical protein OG613_48255 (plasmid) [Streptomyces sp. NBC_00015]|uniref:hypothetical protein n=1 Tax=Streptomyces sp. NBC_00015 TaxID=2903611 RepID=UPI002F90D141